MYTNKDYEPLKEKSFEAVKNIKKIYAHFKLIFKKEKYFANVF